MTDTFTFRVNSDASGEGKAVTHKVQFGDGYEQEAEQGINSQTERWSNTFSGYKAQAVALKNWLLAHKGVAFYWTPPLGEQSFFKWRTYRITPQGGGYYLVTMEFEQVYAP